MPRPITTRSTIGKRYAPVREVSKTTFRNGEVIHTTESSKTLPSGEIQRASSQRVNIAYIPPKPIPRAVPQRRIPSYEYQAPKREMPVYHAPINKIDDAYGGYLKTNATPNVPEPRQQFNRPPPPRISSSPKPNPEPNVIDYLGVGQTGKIALGKTGELFYNASPFGLMETVNDYFDTRQREKDARQREKQREIKVASKGRGGIFGVGDVTPYDTQLITNDFMFGPKPSHNLAEKNSRPPKKLDNAKLYEPSNVYDEYPIEGWF